MYRCMHVCVHVCVTYIHTQGMIRFREMWYQHDNMYAWMCTCMFTSISRHSEHVCAFMNACMCVSEFIHIWLCAQTHKTAYTWKGWDRPTDWQTNQQTDKTYGQTDMVSRATGRLRRKETSKEDGLEQTDKTRQYRQTDRQKTQTDRQRRQTDMSTSCHRAPASEGDKEGNDPAMDFSSFKAAVWNFDGPVHDAVCSHIRELRMHMYICVHAFVVSFVWRGI